MPNHIYNVITLEGDDAEIDRLFQSVKSTEADFDFDKVIPMPPSLNMTDGSITTTSVTAYLRVVNPANVTLTDPAYPKMQPNDFANISQYFKNAYCIKDDELNDCTSPVDPALLKDGEIYVNNYIQYGFTTWYNWRVANWGTKWSAYEVDADRPNAMISFNTAWSTPMPIFEELSRKFPDLSIHFAYTCEFMGDSAGHGTFENGNLVDYVDHPTGSKEAFDEFFAIVGTTAADEGFVYDPTSNTYVYVGDSHENISVKDSYLKPRIGTKTYEYKATPQSNPLTILRRTDPYTKKYDNEEEINIWLIP